jgi:hypothetical protein
MRRRRWQKRPRVSNVHPCCRPRARLGRHPPPGSIRNSGGCGMLNGQWKKGWKQGRVSLAGPPEGHSFFFAFWRRPAGSRCPRVASMMTRPRRRRQARHYCTDATLEDFGVRGKRTETHHPKAWTTPPKALGGGGRPWTDIIGMPGERSYLHALADAAAAMRRRGAAAHERRPSAGPESSKPSTTVQG